jgi:hypothetical protein
MSYWISRDGQKHGPYSLEVLRRLLVEAKLGPTDLVWLEGSPEWVPLVNQAATPTTEPDGRAPQPPVALEPAYFRRFGLIPPSLHWAAVSALSLLTLGLFPLVWSIVMTSFVKKLDDGLPRTLFVAGFVANFGCNIFRVIARAQGEGVTPSVPSGLLLLVGDLLVLVGVACYITAAFRMRRTLLTYYNSIEPIGLYLSDAMTFFFGIFYLQYHLSRIAKWKKTGYLAPQ